MAPPAIDDERPTVEHQFVLATGEIDVNHRHTEAGGALRDQRLALHRLALMKRGGIQVQQDLRTGSGRTLHRRVEPYILADRDPEPAPCLLEHHGMGAGFEIAPFVEHAVIGQLHLAVFDLDHAIAHDTRHVVPHAVAHRRVAEDQGHTHRGLRDLLQCTCHAGIAGRPQQQVLRWIAGQGQLRENDDIGLAAQSRGTIDHAPRIAGDIADDQVELRECNGCRHLLRFSILSGPGQCAHIG